MTKYILLTGAGFSANWGGWLASELWAVLYGHPEVQKNDKLKEILWGYMETGGFEEAYEKIRIKNKSLEPIIRSVIEDSFTRMNNEYRPNRNFSNFIANFCANRGSYRENGITIFTLNQDLFFEKTFYSFCKNKKVGGYESPHQLYLPYIENSIININSKLNDDWLNTKAEDKQILENFDFKSELYTTKYYKLHGSTNFISGEGDNKELIIGTSKPQQIEAIPILKKYYEDYSNALCQEEVRLMVIGYGFGDFHINKQIIKAMDEFDLKLFIITKDKISDIISKISQLIFDHDNSNPRFKDSDLGKDWIKPEIEKIFRKGLITFSNKRLSDVFNDINSNDLDKKIIMERFFIDL